MTDLNAFLPYVNGPLGFLFRHALWIQDRRHRVTKLTPEACHLALGSGLQRAVIYSNPQYSQAAYQNLDWFMRSLHRWDMAANRLTPALNLGFDTYSSQPGAAGIDTRIQANAPTTNEDGSLLATGESNASADAWRSLLKFDLSSLSWVITITSVTLSLWHTLAAASNATTLYIYRQKKAWVETQATWNVYSTGNSWTTAGGFDSADCEQANIGNLALSTSEPNGEKQWTLSNSPILQMVLGSFTNNGFLLKNNVENNDLHVFADSDYGTAGSRPKISIVYTSQDSGGLLL